MITSRISVKKILPVLFFGVIVILILYVAIIIMEKNQTPYDYLKKSNNDNVTAPSELLYQETLDTGFSIVFYIDQRGCYECAIVEDVFLGYRTIGVSGSLNIDNSGTYLYSSFVDGQVKHNICWGILANNDVTEIFLDNEPCNIVETAYSFRVFWLMGLGNDTPSLTTNL